MRSACLLWLLLLSHLILLLNPLLISLNHLFSIFVLVLLGHLLRLENIWAHAFCLRVTSSTFDLCRSPRELILIACLLSAIVHCIQSSHHRMLYFAWGIWHRFISWLLQNFGKLLLVLAQMWLFNGSGFGEVHLGLVCSRRMVEVLLRCLLLLLLLHSEWAWIYLRLLDFQYTWLWGLVVVEEILSGATHLINGHRHWIGWRLLFQIQLRLLARKVLALLCLLRYLRLG